MRRSSVGVWLSASVMAICGCSGSPRVPAPTAPTSPAPSACAFSVAVTQTTFDAVGGTASATVTTGPQCRWTSSAGATSWLKPPAPGVYVGSATFTLAVDPNRSFDSRAGLLEVRDDTNAVPAAQAVTQRGAGCLYSIAPARIRRGWLGTSDGSDVGSFTATVHAEPASCRWTAAFSVPWMQFASYSARSGTGDGTIYVAIHWNSSADTRVGDVVIAGLSGVNPDAHLVVTQTGR